MNQNPFLCSIYAAARRELEKARTHESLSIQFALQQYAAGYIGRSARRLYRMHNEKRELHVTQALRFRQNAKEFRRRLALEWATTAPPPPETAHDAA